MVLDCSDLNSIMVSRDWWNNYPYTCWIKLKENLEIIVDCSWAWMNNMLLWIRKIAHFVTSSADCKHRKQYSCFIHLQYDFRHQIQKEMRDKWSLWGETTKMKRNQKNMTYEKCWKNLGLSLSLESLWHSLQNHERLLWSRRESLVLQVHHVQEEN